MDSLRSHPDLTDLNELPCEDPHNQRVIAFAPTRQDAQLCHRILEQNAIDVCCCDTIRSFCEAIIEGAGVALIAQEYLNNDSIAILKRTLAKQPKWSELPILVLLQPGEIGSQTLERILSIDYVTLINRPLRIAVFVNTVHAKLRDRMRQFEVRDLLIEKDQHQQAVRREARRLDMALQAGGMAAWEWSEAEMFWSKSMLTLLGYDDKVKPSETALFARIHEADLEHIMTQWSQAIEADETFRSEFRIRHPTLGVRWMAAVAEPVKSKSGTTLRYAGLQWDITALKEQTIALQKADAAKSEFLANMSHEIRTPMTAILGYANLLAELVEKEEAREHLRTIRRNGDFLLEIINDILDLSKIEAGKFEIIRELFDPARLIEDVRSVMEVRASENELELHVHYATKIPSQIDSDPKRLKQILINLVGNAIKFTKTGDVEILVSYRDAILTFEIIDTGIGMTRQQLEKLFQPFTQGDSRISRHFGGTGLGLAITRRLTDLLGGRVEAESAYGEGSRFIISVPIGNPADIVLVDPKTVIVPVTNEIKSEPVIIDARILVVDDRRDIRFLSRRILTRAGASVEEAEDGQVAVEHMLQCMRQKNCPDLVLLDMQMPNLDGYETARELRRLGYDRPIIALTADAMQGDMTLCLDAGCNDYLSKPIDAVRLVKMVHDLTATGSLM